MQYACVFCIVKILAGGAPNNGDPRNCIGCIYSLSVTRDNCDSVELTPDQTADFVACREKISQLNAEIAKLKAGMSPDGSSTALSPIGDGDVQLMTEPFDSLSGTASPPELRGADDVAVDPAVMQAKIKQLTSRISEVCSYAAYPMYILYYTVSDKKIISFRTQYKCWSEMY